MGLTVRHFESEPCSRCGGTGRYSFNGQHSICYKCGGARWTLTKAGNAARQAWLTANIDEVPVSDLRVGDTVRMGYATLADMINGTGGRDVLAKVTDVQVGDFGSYSVSGVRYPLTHCWTAKGVQHPTTGGAKVMRWTLRQPLPPEVDPGTDRRLEMREYVESVEASPANA